MKANSTSYTVESEDIFEHIVKEDDFEYNHVVIKPGFSFPPHATDANVIITVVTGILSVKIEDHEVQNYSKGQVINVAQGIMSVLANQQDEKCELFVIKRR